MTPPPPSTDASKQPPPPLTVVKRVDLDATRPLTDPKRYRLVTLSSGLEALLIHDPRMAAGGGGGGGGLERGRPAERDTDARPPTGPERPSQAAVPDTRLGLSRR